MIDIQTELKTWLNGLEIVKLIKATKAFWEKVEVWLQVPLKQIDIENCHPRMVEVHGWGRRVARFPDEDIDLYRKRVLEAFQGAGLIKGLDDILTRFEVPEYTILERLPQVDPDIVTIEMPQGGITENLDLLLNIFQEYGMTCRRYSQTVNEGAVIYVPSAMVGHNQDTETIVPQQVFFDEESTAMSLAAATIAHDQQTEIARM